MLEAVSNRCVNVALLKVKNMKNKNNTTTTPTHLWAIRVGVDLLLEFVFGFFLQNDSFQLDVIHAYILIRISISNLCRTL